MKYPQSKIIWDGIEVTHTWIKTSNIEKYKPINQVYAIVFNKLGKILIGRSINGGNWIIPGGHPEKNETLVETLKREVLEEVDIEVTDILPLGVQKAVLDIKPKKIIYQARFITKLKKILPQTPDPANEKVWERKFVSPEKINEYVRWGETGKAMFKDAIKLSQESP